ncbi:Exonuclease 3'-5' domain-containing protein 2 [Chytriomyces hyalinus]|nr:Exonuclease 3'-5' domain-containing protein 2 [Chytriomyces hyalinus]
MQRALAATATATTTTMHWSSLAQSKREMQLLFVRHVSLRPVVNSELNSLSKPPKPFLIDIIPSVEPCVAPSNIRAGPLVSSRKQPSPKMNKSHTPSLTDIIPVELVKPIKKKMRRTKLTSIASPVLPSTTSSSVSLAGIDIHICDSLISLPRVLNMCGSGPLVSVDLEWNVVMRRGQPVPKTALIQIYNGSSIGLFRLKMLTNGFESPLPKALSDYLEDASVKKVGMNIRGDAAKLNRDFGISMRGYIELSQLAKEVCPELFDGERVSLKKLSERLLNHELDKSDNLRITNWEAKHLRDELVQYAAMDALVGYEVYSALKKRRWSPKAENYEAKK